MISEPLNWSDSSSSMVGGSNYESNYNVYGDYAYLNRNLSPDLPDGPKRKRRDLSGVCNCQPNTVHRKIMPTVKPTEQLSEEPTEFYEYPLDPELTEEYEDFNGEFTPVTGEFPIRPDETPREPELREEIDHNITDKTPSIGGLPTKPDEIPSTGSKPEISDLVLEKCDKPKR